MRSQVMVIGGYGHVGQQICLQLSEVYKGQIVAAGRSYEKAEQFSQQTKGRVRPYKLDVRKPLDSDWMNETKLVIMCLDQEDTSFAETVLRAGIDYIDISAKGAYMEQMAQLDQQQISATALLSVGPRARSYKFISCESGFYAFISGSNRYWDYAWIGGSAWKSRD
ncbi:hypothetical protein BsIDN1_69510 [Bacillus safensis]|uniref:Saccharopine dehydrogenase NADP binding domain-containing protein n=1 Tax=Bacillus safensis TaxID=561879 RepID=A0A5S9MJS0_BACIA|nr:hypothetical protein BsIDN1_69510 [Bacillus safensis]